MANLPLWMGAIPALFVSCPAVAQVYLHSPALETSTGTAADKFPSEANALKPFDDQLAALADFSSRENLTVARFWVSARDSLFARLMAMDTVARDKAMDAAIRERLDQLGIPGAATNPIKAAQLFVLGRGATSQLVFDQATADKMRTNYRADHKEAASADLSCGAVTKPGVALASDRSFTTLQNACIGIVEQSQTLQAVKNAYANGSGLIAVELAAYQEASAQSQDQSTDATDALQSKIEAAVAAAKSGGDPASELDDFKKLIDDGFKGVSAATKLVSLTKVSHKIDSTLIAEGCAAESSDARAKDATCAGFDPASTGSRIEAGWALARALVALSTASSRDQVAAQWLVAAKAIVAAERANAQLLVDRSNEEAAAHLARSQTLEREGYYLSLAFTSLHGPRGGCHDPKAGGDIGPNSHCALASYLDAWNEGQVPAAVQAYRPIQIERAYAVRQARIVAQKEHALAAAAAAELKAYGAGGIKPEMLAQLLFDIALIGTTAGN